MPTTYIAFRGEPDVEIEYRLGRYESDTNAQELEWWFVGHDAPDDLTPEEEDAIASHCYAIGDEPDPELGVLPIPREHRDPATIGTPLPEISGRPGHPGFDEFCRIARSWGYP